jgi:hypothetical protein
MADAADPKRRDQLRQQHVEQVPAEAEAKADLEETPHTLAYSQWLRHPRLKWAVRRLELWKDEPRARLKLRLYRLPSADPEILYATFQLPCEGTLPRLSCGGVPFTPYTDQLPGSCRDYFAIDGWADFATSEGHWLWVSRDVPLLTLGNPQVWTRHQTPPSNPQRLLSMLYNNLWYTNFLADEPGVMEFEFAVVWREKVEGSAQVAALAEALVNDPVVLINSAGQDDSIIMQRLFTP